MITRIILIGPGRINEACVTLSFDYNLHPQPDITYVVSPYPQHMIDRVFAEFNLDVSKYQFLDDLYFDEHYDLSRYKKDHWYYQQAIKLCALDYFDSEYFIIQDCDQVPLKPYHMWVDGKLNYKLEVLWNPYQTIYAEMVKALIGLDRVVEYSLVNELMPYSKQDWLSLKTLLEQRHNTSWLDAIADIRGFDEVKWLSEFELLGIYKTHMDDWTSYIAVPQPPIMTWEDFFQHDWAKQDTVKFLTQPLKYMNTESAKIVLEHLTNL